MQTVKLELLVVNPTGINHFLKQPQNRRVMLQVPRKEEQLAHSCNMKTRQPYLLPNAKSLLPHQSYRNREQIVKGKS